MFAKPVYPERNTDGSSMVVVLERIEPGVTPDYCVHGRVTCYFCDEWCWLGDKTHDQVISGKAAPICLECATEKIPQTSPPGGPKLMGRLDDTRRDVGH